MREPSESQREDRLIGRVLEGRYRIEEVLGAGGVGVVYRAMQTLLNRPVAIKVLNEEYCGVEELHKRFQREARALSSLSHPHIVQLNDYGISSGMPYLVMELLEGRTLADLIDDPSGPPAPELALDIGRQILRGLSFAHARGILHRDLKPGNVFLQRLPDEPYHVKLLDFGLAKMFSDEDGLGEPTLTRMGTILGTPAYMSPEQASGGRVDIRTDVYSFGVMLFEMLTGRYPFVADTRHEMLRAHMLDPVPRVADVRDEITVTRELQALIERAMSKERSERFVDAAAVLDALDALPKPAASMKSLSQRPPKPVRRPAMSQESTIRVSEHGSDVRIDPDDELFERASSQPLSQSVRLGRRSEGRARKGVIALLVFALLIAGGLAAAYRYLPGRTTSEPTPPEPEVAIDVAPSPDPPPDEVIPPDEVVPVPPDVPDAAPVVAEVVRPPARDPFDAPLPSELRRFHQKVRRGLELGRHDTRDLLELQREMREDPRPVLILGHASVDARHFSDAIDYYTRAYQIDPTSRGDRRMAEDLVRLARTPSVGARAADAVVELFGREAGDALTRELATEMPDDERARLEALRDRISS